ncbi:MAG: hypothetical protein M3275_01500 [Thermoproteota archaeon]|nr:hypothetical protein [Thermoproteota archaeon]
MEQAGSVIHSTFAIDVIWSGGYEGARNECKKSEIHRRIEVVHFAVSVLIAKVVTLWAQEQEATIRLFEDYSAEIEFLAQREVEERQALEERYLTV